MPRAWQMLKGPGAVMLTWLKGMLETHRPGFPPMAPPRHRGGGGDVAEGNVAPGGRGRGDGFGGKCGGLLGGIAADDEDVGSVLREVINHPGLDAP